MSRYLLAEAPSGYARGSPTAPTVLVGATSHLAQRGSYVNVLEQELAEIAASGVGLRQRAESLLASLRPRVPFDAAWMALADTQHPDYTTVAAVDLDDSVRDYLHGPIMAADIETTGTNRSKPPLSPSDLPYPR